MTRKSGKLMGLAEFLEEQDIVSLIRLNLFLFFGIAVVGLAGYVIVRDDAWAHFARNGLLLMAGSLFVIFLLYKKRLSLAAYASLVIYGLILTYSAWTGAGVKGTNYALFFLLVVGAALFIGRRAGYITALIAALVGVILLMAGRSGLLVNADRPSVDFVTWITLSVCFFIAAHIGGLAIKQVERSLERSQREAGEGEHRFRRVFEVSPVAIVVTTLDEGRLVEANDAYWQLSGHDPKTSIGRTTVELREGYDSDRRQDFINALVEQKSIKDPNYIFVDDAGIHHYTMAFYELIDLDGQPMILSMFYDMTEQVEAKNALQHSEERLRGLLKAIPDTIFELRRDGLVLQYVPSDEGFSSVSSGELLGRSIDQIMPSSVAGQIMFAVERALESGLLHIIEFQLRQAGNDQTYEARVEVSGEDTVLMIVRDVSFHKWLETERENLINELDSKNSELERFTYTVSHDLKSPLITVRGFLGLLKDDIAAGDASRVQTDVQRIGTAMETMQSRLDDILELSRAGRLTDKSEMIRFNDLVTDALELVHGRISQRGITVHVDEDLPSIIGDRHRLLEVLQNLLDNAAKFMGDQTNPRIEVGQRGGEDNKSIFFIKDNGMGISPEHHEKIFGIFNKLDPRAEGTGIGLALVEKVIEAHGGRIWVESEAGKGTTFYFTLLQV